jgi:hypothetical protein
MNSSLGYKLPSAYCNDHYGLIRINLLIFWNASVVDVSYVVFMCSSEVLMGCVSL